MSRPVITLCTRDCRDPDGFSMRPVTPFPVIPRVDFCWTSVLLPVLLTFEESALLL